MVWDGGQETGLPSWNAMCSIQNAVRACLVAGYFLTMGYVILTEEQVLERPWPKFYGNHHVPVLRYIGGLCAVVILSALRCTRRADGGIYIGGYLVASIILILTLFTNTDELSTQLSREKANVQQMNHLLSTQLSREKANVQLSTNPTELVRKLYQHHRKLDEWDLFRRVCLKDTCELGHQPAECSPLKGMLLRSWKPCTSGNSERLLRNLQASSATKSFRVAAFGGSVTRGRFYTTTHGIWTHRLQVYLTRMLPKGTKVEVFNFAVPASGVGFPLSRFGSYNLTSMNMVVSEFSINQPGRDPASVKELERWYDKLLGLNGPQIVVLVFVRTLTTIYTLDTWYT